jgi:hypothetical protein
MGIVQARLQPIAETGLRMPEEPQARNLKAGNVGFNE